MHYSRQAVPAYGLHFPIKGSGSHVPAPSRSRALKEASIPFDGALVLEGEFDPADARERFGKLLSAAPDITAVICANIDITEGVYAELLARGIRVPQDISVVVFCPDRHFTYIDQRTDLIGKNAARILLAVLNGGKAPKAARVEPELVAGHSTAPPRKSTLTVRV